MKNLTKKMLNKNKTKNKTKNKNRKIGGSTIYDGSADRIADQIKKQTILMMGNRSLGNFIQKIKKVMTQGI